MPNPLNLDILTKTFENMPVGVGIFHVPDLNDIKSIRYVFMNKIVLHEMRKDRNEVFGKRIIEVAPEAFNHEGGVKVMETYRKVAAQAGSVNLGLVQYSNHMVAGTYECSVHHIQPHYVYVILRNVTELEQAKIELEQKNNELKQFAYIVSHDLQAPLHTVLGFIKLIKDGYEAKLDTAAQEMFSFITGATQRMQRLIDDLLEYSKLDQKQELTLVNCHNLVQLVQKDMAEQIQQSGTTIQLDTLPTVQGYETALRMLFQNLIGNAIKFRKPDTPPSIKIYAKQQNGWTFYVEDNGIGMETKHKDKIFQVFKRLHSDSEYDGTGIGLAHCKKVVDMHNGSIGVTTTIGKGSTFYFNIPSP